MLKRSHLMKLIDKEMSSEDPTAELDERIAAVALKNKIAAGPPVGSGISADNWSSWHEYGWLCCPMKPKTTCCKPGCKIGIGCEAMAVCGLAGDGTPLAHAARPACCANTREGHPCRNKVVPGKRRCKYHGGLSTGPRTPEGRARIAAAQRRRWGKNATPLVVDRYQESKTEEDGCSFMSI